MYLTRYNKRQDQEFQQKTSNYEIRQITILTLKNTIIKIKNAIKGFKSNQAKLKSKLGNWEMSPKKIQNNAWKDRLENTKVGVKDIGYTMRRVNICVLGIPKQRKEKIAVKLQRGSGSFSKTEYPTQCKKKKFKCLYL